MGEDSVRIERRLSMFWMRCFTCIDSISTSIASVNSVKKR